MTRLELPITDYVGDQTSVLDQSIRIIQASIDVLAELGFLSSCLRMISLLQAIKSARWPDECPASMLPGVDDGADDRTPLASVAAMQPQQLGKLADALGVPKPQRRSFTEAASRLPDVALSVPHKTALGLTAQLRRRNPLAERDARAYAPRFPKPQSEGWFVIAADPARDEVLAIKRLGWSARGGAGLSKGARPEARAVLKLPGGSEAGGGERKVDVLVVSDTYIGLEHRVTGVEIPAAPVVEGDGLDKKKTQPEGGDAERS